MTFEENQTPANGGHTHTQTLLFPQLLTGVPGSHVAPFGVMDKGEGASTLVMTLVGHSARAVPECEAQRL